MINKNPKRAIIIIFIIINVIFFIIALVLPYTLNRFLYTPIKDILAITLGMLAIPLGAISLALSMFIASRQDMQLGKLTTIGVQTGSTVDRLTTESSIQNKIKNFFNNYGSDDSPKKYKCIYPVTYDIKNPLPQVSQADFYVFHVLGSHMKEENLEIMGISNNHQFRDGESLDENAILVCTKNPWLKKFYEIKEIKTDDNVKETRDWFSKNLKLPCWFVNDLRGDKTKRNIKIMVSTDPDECGHLDFFIESPANEIYSVVENSNGNVKDPHEDIIQRDYAIFARLSKSVNNSPCQHIIIAGIHQYGTWIIGELLNLLICGKEIEYDSTFLDNNDFICIITGEFIQNKLKVKKDSIQVYNRYIWIKESDRWTRKYTEKENQKHQKTK